jgi:two-component system, NtrC family, sensor kinase
MQVPQSNAKNKIRIPLFWKFTIGMVVVVVLFGSINVALVHRIIFSSLEDEMQQRGVFMSQIISQRAINYILFDDIVALHVLLDEVKTADETIKYILISDRDGRITAHTFDGMFPGELQFLHAPGNEIKSAHLSFKGHNSLIRDISIPLLDGSIGYLRLGITEDHITHTLNQATTTLFGMIFILIVISLIGTFIFSYLVTSPVKNISNIAESLNMQSIREKKVMFASRYPTKASRIMYSLPGDEIDILVSKFNEMVSRLQQAYEELEIAQKKLVQSEKLASIGTLAAGVAHEVNNPIAGILNCIARMKKNPENRKEAEKYLELMDEAAHKVEWVIKSLLDFARHPDYKSVEVDLAEIIKSALSLAAHRLDKNRIEVSLPDINGIHVKGNRNLLEQVLLNIIINSIDAIEEKQQMRNDYLGRIVFNVESMITSRKIFLEIKDNGTGIAEENMNKVYDPFFTTKAVGKGTGLGLSVSMNIIKEHAGELEISSVFCKGTTVRIILPLFKKELDEDFSG